MKRRRVFISGRFLTQQTSGIQRYARQLVLTLDRNMNEADDIEWILVCPKGTVDSLLNELKVIRPLFIGSGRSHIWEQTYLAGAASSGVLLSLCNSGPLLHRWQLVVIHDAAVFRAPKQFGLLYRLFHSTLGMLLSRSACIATVSEFSRSELADVLRISKSSIAVIPNGGAHLSGIKPDDAVYDRLGLGDRPYFLTVGNQSRNKNIGLAIEAFMRVPERFRAALVVVGAGVIGVFGDVNWMEVPGVVFAGRRTDAELAALYKGATALIFPSFYEGFGIPPLEALELGCPVLASTAPALVEVCGDSAYYFEPHDDSALCELMITRLQDVAPRPDIQEAGRVRAGKYSWDRSAVLLKESANDLLDRFQAEI